MREETVVDCINLSHFYGEKLVYKNMSFSIKQGSVFGLLGKNGTGKTTTINILSGFLKPTEGKCLIFGENAHNLSSETKARIGFALEGHVQYGFMNINQIEKFYSAFYPKWQSEPFFELMSKMDITDNQKIATMSSGQQSQVALGLVLAQDPDLLILDDYSMGLDAGYRRLFLDYLSEYALSESKTIFITSHIIQDLENLIQDFAILDREGVLLSGTVTDFKNTFKHYKIEVNSDQKLQIEKNNIITNFEFLKNKISIFTFADINKIKSYLSERNIAYNNLIEIPMSLEDAFVGMTGKY